MPKRTQIFCRAKAAKRFSSNWLQQMAGLLPALRSLSNAVYVIEHRVSYSLTAIPHFWSDVGRVARVCFSTLLVFPLVFFFVTACAPSKDTVLSDVERNYTGVGFLDTDTFQIICPLPSGEDRLAICRQKLIAALVEYKERYDREAFARRMHQDFLPFFRPAEVSEAEREEWRRFYHVLAEGRSRIVFERVTGEGIEGVYRLRLRDLIYRVQKAR